MFRGSQRHNAASEQRGEHEHSAHPTVLRSVVEAVLGGCNLLPRRRSNEQHSLALLILD
jgi:hypothetical protein